MHPFLYGTAQYGGYPSHEQVLLYQRKILEDEIYAIEERQWKAQRHRRRQFIRTQALQVEALLKNLQLEQSPSSAAQTASPTSSHPEPQPKFMEMMLAELLKQNGELQAVIRQHFNKSIIQPSDETHSSLPNSTVTSDEHPHILSPIPERVVRIDTERHTTNPPPRIPPDGEKRQEKAQEPSQAWNAIEELPEIDWTDADEELFEQLQHGETSNVDGSTTAMGGQSGVSYGDPNDKGVSGVMQRKRQHQDRHESRRKLAQVYEASSIVNNIVIRRPRWRIDQDRASGVVKPFGENGEDELPMPARQLLRSVTIAVVAVFEMQRLLRATKLRLRDKSIQDLEPMLNVCFDATRVWLGKLVKTPLLSIVEDRLLDIDMTVKTGLFQATKGFSKWFGKSHSTTPTITPASAAMNATAVDHSRIVKLKVRVKGIVDVIAKAIEKGEIPIGILEFWKRLTVDGVYFPSTYPLFALERESLDLDLLGATRNIDGDYKGYSRFQIILINFMLLRILIPHVVLRPWELGIGAATAPKAVHVNLKNVATLLYAIIARLSPLPGISSDGEVSMYRGLRRRSVEVVPVVDASKTPTSLTVNNKSEEVNTGGDRFLSIAQIHGLLIPEKNFPLNQFEPFVNEQQHRLRDVLLGLQLKLHPRPSEPPSTANKE